MGWGEGFMRHVGSTKHKFMRNSLILLTFWALQIAAGNIEKSVSVNKSEAKFLV
jgi:hypothetical protein